MVMYVLIGLSLALVGVCGLQFFYLAYIDQVLKSRKDYESKLERRCSRLAAALEETEQRLEQHANIIRSIDPELLVEDETWAEVIHD